MSMTHPPCILVAEDDPVSRHLLQFTLHQAGYVVVTAADGEQAWERLQHGDIDLLLTDHQMPRCSGVELLERIEAARHGGRNLVDAAILCTAKGLELDRQKLQKEHGLLAVIGKPFSPRRLAQTIDDHFVSVGLMEVNTHCAVAGESWGVWNAPA